MIYLVNYRDEFTIEVEAESEIQALARASLLQHILSIEPYWACDSLQTMFMEIEGEEDE